MPPQAALNDLQVAQVTNYVRSKWGNHGAEVDEAYVSKVKAKAGSNGEIWSSRKLIRTFRYNNKPSKINHLVAERYDYIDDLTTIDQAKPKAVEEENGGALTPKQAGDAKEAFSARWTGTLTAQKSDTYHFSLKTDHKAQLLINGEPLITTTESASPAISKGIKLEKGKINLELRYSHLAKTPTEALLFRSGPGFDLSPLHVVAKKKVPAVPIPLTPPPNRALVHRNFLNKKGYRTMAVGYPEKVNFIFSVEHLNIDTIWAGDFIDVGRTWNGRARGGIATPLAKNTSSLGSGHAFKTITANSTSWNDASEIEDVKFLGFEYNAAGHPTFTYRLGEAHVTDHFTPAQDGKSMERKITVEDAPQGLTFRLTDTGEIKENNTIKFSPTLTIENLSSEPTKLSDALIVPISDQPLTLTYTWK